MNTSDRLQFFTGAMLLIVGYIGGVVAERVKDDGDKELKAVQERLDADLARHAPTISACWAQTGERIQTTLIEESATSTVITFIGPVSGGTCQVWAGWRAAE